MNYKKEKEAYLNIKAPTELKGRILDQIEHHSQRKQPVYWKPAFYGFAIILMFITISSYQASTSIFVNHQKLTKNATILKMNDASTNIRTINENPQVFDIKIPKIKSYEIIASEGEVLLDKNNNCIKWILENQKATKSYKLYLINEDKKSQIILKYDNDQDVWTIQYKEKN